MSLAGQVLCQRMLIGPCALTIVGATAVAAAPVAATFKKWRLLDVSSFLDLLIVLSVRFTPQVVSMVRRQVWRRVFGKNGRNDATLRRGLRHEVRTSRPGLLATVVERMKMLFG